MLCVASSIGRPSKNSSQTVPVTADAIYGVKIFILKVRKFAMIELLLQSYFVGQIIRARAELTGLRSQNF